MHVYKARTEEILQRFFDQRIDRSQCVNELYAAFTALLPNLTADNVEYAREVVCTDAEAIIKETRRRDGLPTITGCAPPASSALYQ